MFLPTSPGGRGTEPGVIERKGWVVSTVGCLRASDAMSTAVGPTITKGEGDLGWYEFRERSVVLRWNVRSPVSLVVLCCDKIH